MDEIRAVAPSGMLGSGFLESSLTKAMGLDPHFIACDAGSTDTGPDPLATGRGQFPRSAIKRDLRLMLLAARKAGVPLIIGSCGTGGGELGLNLVRDVTLEVAKEEDLHFKLALVHSEQDREYLQGKLHDGKITPLKPAPALDEEVINRSIHIVGMMGPEPIAKALEEGADVVLAGRSSDTSLFAALPMVHGFPEAPVWHAAKTLECGAACAAIRKSPDCMFAYIRKDHFVVEPPGEHLWCTPQSVASHTLYENADPYHLYECSGMLDTSSSRYEAVSDRAVKVSDSRWVPADKYTVKLEGVELAGQQSVAIGGIRDPIIIRQIDSWLESLREKQVDRIYEAFGGLEVDKDYSLHFRVYGRNGAMGSLEPVETPAHELCLFIEVTAPEQGLAESICTSCAGLALHHPVPEWHGLITGMAYPYSPPVLNRGPVHRFNLNHVVEPDDPYEMFPREMVQV